MEWIIVAVGGGIGATLRYWVQLLVIKVMPSYWSTALVNVLGSFMLGIASHKVIESSSIVIFLTVGILGAFTTFSTFAFEVVKLVEIRKQVIALLFIGINLIGGLLAFWMGWVI